MAAAPEQPLKKRKLYDQPPPPPPSPPQEPPPPPPPTPPLLSNEEIIRRRRAQEEIRHVFECYRRIKFCINQKDKRLPDIEEPYLALIAASRGGTSVKRLVAEYIPRYASYCPTALEAAAKVIINMHDWCVPVISRGEDVDGIAFECVKACILGLVDICQVASAESSSSSVIQGICSAVFRSIFVFLVSSFEGKDIFQIVDYRTLKIHDIGECFSDLKREFLEEDNSILLKLSKLRALCFLKILFCNPKSSLLACFGLFETTGLEGPQTGKYFLQQLTMELNDVGVCCRDETSSDTSSLKFDGKHLNASSDNSLSNSSMLVTKNCLLRLMLGGDQSLRSLIFCTYQTICDSASPEIVSGITSVLEGVFESFTQQVKAENRKVNSLEGISGSSKYSPYLVSRASGHHGSPVVSGKQCADKISNFDLKTSSPAVNACIDPVNAGESKGMDVHYGDTGDSSSSRTFMPRELLTRHSFSPKARAPREFRSNSFPVRNVTTQIEKSPVPNMDLPAPAVRPSTNSPFESPRHNISSPHCSTNSAICYSDGDPAAMDIFLASKQLWLGSLGPDALEMHVRCQFEKFGFIDQLRYFPVQGFATVEYRNILDAVKARYLMRGRSPWGACLLIKFLDTGLGSKGAVNGTAVGSSSYVYVGNVSSKWAKDDMIHEVKKVLHKGPRMVIDLSNEGALLMEFDSPEEAATSIGHLRLHRKENSNLIASPSNAGPTNLMMHASGARPASALFHVDARNNVSSNSMIRSPQGVMHVSGARPASAPLHVDTRNNVSANSMIGSPQGKMHVSGGRPASASIHVDTRNNLSASSTIVSPQGRMYASGGRPPTSGSLHVDTRNNVSANSMIGSPQGQTVLEKPPEGYHGSNLAVRPDSNLLELTSPRMSQEIRGPRMQTAHAFQSPWNTGGMPEAGRIVAAERPWMYGKPEMGMISAQTRGPSVVPPQQVPQYAPPNSLWGSRGLGHHPPPNYVPQNAQGPPFLPPSVTPLTNMHGSTMGMFDHRFSLPGVPPPLSSLPPPTSNVPPRLPQLDSRPSLSHTELQPPLPSTPPPPHPPPPPPNSQSTTFLPPHTLPPAFTPPPHSQTPRYTPTHSQPSAFTPPPSHSQPPTFTPPPHSQPPAFTPPAPHSQPPALPPPPPQSQPSALPPPPPQSQPSALPPPPPQSQPPALPPPPPQSQPPALPPPPPHQQPSALPHPSHSQPPSFPPPGPSNVSSDTDCSKSCQEYPWQGVLSKSGVHYCTIFAQRVDSDICHYSNAVAEPAEWPAKLDLTKRTDTRHVKSTFSSTPPHRREVCWLLPSTPNDHKGLQDFTLYLKQRDCAGVIKIPAAKSIWPRLLFILPYSLEICSMLSIPPNESPRLIGLVLPKDSNSE